MMVKKTIGATKLASMTDAQVDKTFKLVGTNYDRRRRVTNDTIRKMNQMVGAGKTLSKVANHFNVSIGCVKYNTNPEFKAYINAQRKNYASSPAIIANFANRVKYKRLILSQKQKLFVAQ